MSEWRMTDCHCPRCKTIYLGPVDHDHPVYHFLRRKIRGVEVKWVVQECLRCTLTTIAPSLHDEYERIHNVLLARCEKTPGLRSP